MDSDQAARHQALNTEAKRLLVDCTYTGRGHQAAGRRWSVWNNRLGLPTAIASTLLAGGAGLSAVVDRQPWITATLAVLAAMTSAAHGFLRPGEIAQEHSLKGNRFIALRNDARLFREIDLRSGLSEQELAVRLRDLRQRYHDLNETPPLHIPRQDYLAAKQSIESGESNYENDPLWKEMED